MQQEVKSIKIDPSELDLINQYSRRPLTEDEVYTFSVVLCDNEIDRDNEAFTEQALHTLAEMFVGKTGIFDHNPSSKNQTARIFAAAAEPTGELTSYGAAKIRLKARAYMVRSEKRQDMMKEIDAGILKEVSVGCRVGKKVCSICGAEYDGLCGHEPGKSYDGKICFVQLSEPLDAYEWSFVAVPAQPGAGVVKGLTMADDELKKQARAGRRYIEQLRGEVVRMAYLDGFMTDQQEFASIVKKMDEKELAAFRDAFSKRQPAFSEGPQLTHCPRSNRQNSEFKMK